MDINLKKPFLTFCPLHILNFHPRTLAVRTFYPRVLLPSSEGDVPQTCNSFLSSCCNFLMANRRLKCHGKQQEYFSKDISYCCTKNICILASCCTVLFLNEHWKRIALCQQNETQSLPCASGWNTATTAFTWFDRDGRRRRSMLPGGQQIPSTL